MNALKKITYVFFSLTTTLWLLGVSLILFFAGAFIMPGKEEFQALHSVPLFDWIQVQPFKITWWLWCLIAVLSVLAVNTLFCSVESIVKKRKVTQWLLLISPQVIHSGFLCILFAHLLSAYGASQQVAAGREGTLLSISGDHILLKIKNILIIPDYYGYINDWEVTVEYVADGRTLYEDTIKPNNPSDKLGMNIIVKDLRAYPDKVVLLQIHREPGARWALIGGILFMIGICTLIILKIKVER